MKQLAAVWAASLTLTHTLTHSLCHINIPSGARRVAWQVQGIRRPEVPLWQSHWA